MEQKFCATLPEATHENLRPDDAAKTPATETSERQKDFRPKFMPFAPGVFNSFPVS
jgi:hypothetical protein